MRPAIVWAVLAALYAAFFGWYTSCAGPLSPEEVEHYVALVEQRGSSPDEVAKIRRFLETDTGDDFVVVNAIELREPPGRVEGVEAGETAEQVMARYMQYMWPALLSRGGHPVLFGTVAADALDVWGIDGAERWSRAGIMRYRSRRDLMEIATNPEFSGRHEYKVAAMVKTIAFPADPWLQLGDPRLVLGLLFAAIGFMASWLGERRRHAT